VHIGGARGAIHKGVEVAGGLGVLGVIEVDASLFDLHLLGSDLVRELDHALVGVVGVGEAE
jgi:hypothetical protein